MRKDIWEAETFDGIICVRCTFWHRQQKGVCMQAISTAMWRDLSDREGFLKHLIKVMQFDKADLIESL